MQIKTFELGIKKLIAVAPEKQIEFDVFFSLLKHIPNDIFIRAIDEICLSVRDINKSTNLIALIQGYYEKETQIIPEEAWLEVLDEIRRTGWNNQPIFSDYKIMKAINANGGWRKLCASEEINWDKKRFIASYEDFKDVEQAQIRQGLNPSDEKLSIEDDSKMTEMFKTIG